MARPTKWSKEIEQQAWDYVNGGWERAGDTIPSHAGLCVLLQLNKSTLYDWATHEDKKFSDILSACNAKQEQTLLNGSLNNTLNANISKLVLGKHGYHEKQDIAQDITSKGESIKNEWHIHPTSVKAKDAEG